MARALGSGLLADHSPDDVAGVRYSSSADQTTALSGPSRETLDFRVQKGFGLLDQGDGIPRDEKIRDRLASSAGLTQIQGARQEPAMRTAGRVELLARHFLTLSN